MLKNITLSNLRKYWKVILIYVIVETIVLDNILFFERNVIIKFLVGTVFYILFIYFLDKYIESKK